MGLDRLDFSHQMINQIVFRKAQKYRNSLNSIYPRSLRVADIGCGTGYLLKQFISSGWDSIGLDPYPRGDSLKMPLREHVIQGTIESIGSSRFDLLTAVEVIEHSNDYLVLLKEMRRTLVPGGQIILTVPNSWEFHTLTTDEGEKEPKYGHLWKFDATGLRRDLEALFTDVGVEAIYSRWLDRRLFWIIRHLPPFVVIAVSEGIVRRRKNGAWLLAWGRRPQRRLDGSAPLPKPSAARYLSSRRSNGTTDTRHSTKSANG